MKDKFYPPGLDEAIRTVAYYKKVPLDGLTQDDMYQELWRAAITYNDRLQRAYLVNPTITGVRQWLRGEADTIITQHPFRYGPRMWDTTGVYTAQIVDAALELVFQPGRLESIAYSTAANEPDSDVGVAIAVLSDVHSAIYTLPTQRRHVLELRYKQGLTLQEIADTYGISRPAALKKLNAARAVLLRYLSRGVAPFDRVA